MFRLFSRALRESKVCGFLINATISIIINATISIIIFLKCNEQHHYHFTAIVTRNKFIKLADVGSQNSEQRDCKKPGLTLSHLKYVIKSSETVGNLV